MNTMQPADLPMPASQGVASPVDAALFFVTGATVIAIAAAENRDKKRKK
jgi:hypothetical protein